MRLFVTLIMVVTVICAKACPLACECNDFVCDASQDDIIHTSITCRSAFNSTSDIPKSINKLNFYNLSYSETNVVLNNNLLTQENFPKLYQVSFKHCSVFNLSYASLNGLSKLKALDLSHSKITYLIEPFNTTNLEALDLSNNGVRVIDDNPFHMLSSLKFLNLSGNIIETLNQTIFIGMSELQSLDLAANKLSVLNSEYFIPLSTLQYLNLSNNLLQVLNEACCDSLQRLRHLDVSGNRLARVAPGSLQLPSLSHLVLAENPALGRSRSPSLLIGLGKRLQNVDISNTGLSQVPAAITHSIKILRLSRNFIRYVGCGHLDSYPLLKILDFRFNYLEVIEDDALGRLDMLSELYLSDNKLHSPPRHLPESLKKLFLEHNQIESLSRGDFKGMPFLETLTLCDNKIKAIQEGAFTELENLSSLDLSRNPIKILPAGALEGPRRLRVLRLANLSVISPAEEMTFPLPTTEHLIILDLSNSSSLGKQFLADTAALAASRELQELYLSGGQLKHIRSDLLNFLPQLRLLHLFNNPLNCDELQWMQLRNRSEVTQVVCTIYESDHKNNTSAFDNHSFKASEVCKKFNEANLDHNIKNTTFKNERHPHNVTEYSQKNIILRKELEEMNADTNNTNEKLSNELNLWSTNISFKRTEKVHGHENSTVFNTTNVQNLMFDNETAMTGKIIMYSESSKGHPGILVLIVVILSASSIFIVMLFKSRKCVNVYRRHDNEVSNTVPNATELW